MAKTEMLHVRLEPEMKLHADKMFRALGITTGDAVKMFLAAALRAGGLPFEVIAPEYRYSMETIAAMEEAKRIARDPEAKRYTDADELMKDLLADD
ncbi:MAG: type II toxin-antitoxin system RelB/DinJ family antitoxin [Cloacibacillus sp.]